MENKQLFEKQADSYNPFFPLVRLEDIIETISDKSIQWILNNYNHIYVEYSESTAITRNKVPTLLRRTGLWISYNNGKEIITEYYKGSNNDVQNYIQWTIDDNWERFDKIKHLDGSITYQHLSEALKQLMVGGNNITNFPDEEDLTTDGVVLSLKDRKYEPHNFSGLGRVILRKNIIINKESNIQNILTQNMINKANTIYEIRYDFDLNGAEITIPEGCVLDFQGGSLSNGSIRNCRMSQSSEYIFKDIDVICSHDSFITPYNFGAKLDGITDDTIAINAFFRCLYLSKCMHEGSGNAYVTDTITIPCRCHLPDLNFVYPNGYDKTAIFIDNYRFDSTLDSQSGENMIRDVTITIGSVVNKNRANIGSAAIKVSSSRDIVVNANKLYGFDAGLLLEAYDFSVGYVSYSTFNIKTIINCKSGIKMRQYSKSGDKSKIGWVTECSFYSPTISTPTDGLWDEVNYIDMQTDEGNTIDGHVFYHPCIEGAYDTANTKRWAISLKHAILNTFICPRIESAKDSSIRWLGSYNNNEYANTFIGVYGNYSHRVFEGIYGDNINRYIILGSPMYSSNLKNAAAVEPPLTYPIEQGNYAKLPKGLSALPFIIKEKPSTAQTDRGAGLAVIGSTSPWERGGNFMLWANASSSNALYFRKSKEADDNSGSNFGDWYEIQKRNISAPIESKEYANPDEGGFGHKYDIFQQYVGCFGITTKLGNNRWLNKRGFIGILSGALEQVPFGTGYQLNGGDCYLGVYTEGAYKPLFYVGGSDVPLDNWVTASGERPDSRKKGTTEQRPNPNFIGYLYFDESLNNKPIWYIGGGKWVDANGTEV